MTETEWLSTNDPFRMLEWLRRSKMLDRHRLGLLFVECCSRISPSVVEATKPGKFELEDDDPIALTDAEFHLIEAVLESMRSIPTGERTEIAGIIRDLFGASPD